jgi:VWFA-related protein
MLGVAKLWAQAGAAAAPPAPSAGSSQTAADAGRDNSARDETTTFKVRVNLVLVRAVVRDAKGNAVGNLRKEDFQLFDKGKPQVISQFTVEAADQRTALAARQPEPAGAAREAGAPHPAPLAPDRYVAYVFDDVHMAFADMARVRQAAARHLATLSPTTRAAIFTTSGQGNLDFTDDRTRLEVALKQLLPHPIAGTLIGDCPQIGEYQADLILSQSDTTALNIAVQEMRQCGSRGNLEERVRVMAREVFEISQHESRLALSVLQDVVRRMAMLPGQRSIFLLSPGFYASQLEYVYDAVVEQALRVQVTISSLNGRGLYTVDPLGDISRSPVMLPAGYAAQKMILVQSSATANESILAGLADGTGGVYFHNSNDFDQGFREIAASAEYAYVLGFSPQDLKPDGKFHELKVVARDSPKLKVQARKGYFAPKQGINASEQAKQDIEEALFSRTEVHDLPVDLQTQFSKSGAAKAQLDVLAHVDVQRMRLQKAGERSAGTLTVVAGLFDSNGKFVSGIQKVVDMHLKDETLADKLGSGIIVKSSFDVAPGSYLVRLVVRDTEGELATANGSIEIP